MDEATARARLKRMTAANSMPQLDTEAIDDLLLRARRVDIFGLSPTDTGWTVTYDLNWAAAEGWRQKGGLAAEQVTFRAGDLASYDDLLFQHIDKMITHYQRLIGGASSISPYVDTTGIDVILTG
jgi:hypothetical protein